MWRWATPGTAPRMWRGGPWSLRPAALWSCARSPSGSSSCQRSLLAWASSTHSMYAPFIFWGHRGIVHPLPCGKGTNVCHLAEAPHQSPTQYVFGVAMAPHGAFSTAQAWPGAPLSCASDKTIAHHTIHSNTVQSLIFVLHRSQAASLLRMHVWSSSRRQDAHRHAVLRQHQATDIKQSR